MEKGQRITFWEYLAYFTLPALTYFSLSGLIAYGLMLRFSPWLAVPLGLVVGSVILAAWIAGQGGTSTVIELNITCAILLILLAIFAPVVVKLRHSHLHRHHRPHSKPAFPNISPQKTLS